MSSHKICRTSFPFLNIIMAGRGRTTMAGLLRSGLDRRSANNLSGPPSLTNNDYGPVSSTSYELDNLLAGPASGRETMTGRDQLSALSSREQIIYNGSSTVRSFPPNESNSSVDPRSSTPECNGDSCSGLECNKFNSDTVPAGEISPAGSLTQFASSGAFSSLLDQPAPPSQPSRLYGSDAQQTSTSAESYPVNAPLHHVPATLLQKSHSIFTASSPATFGEMRRTSPADLPGQTYMASSNSVCGNQVRPGEGRAQMPGVLYPFAHQSAGDIHPEGQLDMTNRGRTIEDAREKIARVTTALVEFTTKMDTVGGKVTSTADQLAALTEKVTKLERLIDQVQMMSDLPRVHRYAITSSAKGVSGIVTLQGERIKIKFLLQENSMADFILQLYTRQMTMYTPAIVPTHPAGTAYVHLTDSSDRSTTIPVNLGEIVTIPLMAISGWDFPVKGYCLY